MAHIRRVLSGVLIVLAAGSIPAGVTAEELTLERLLGMPPLLQPLPSAIKWVGGGHGVACVQRIPGDEGVRSALVIREVPSGKERVVVFADTVAVPADLAPEGGGRFSLGSPEWDPDGNRAVFTFGGDVFLVDRAGGRIERATDTDGAEKDPSFSPDGRVLVYTRQNDLYTLDLSTRTETRHTTGGCDSVYNGVLNWVYMEELFTRGDVRAHWWSPDGQRLAFLEIREGPVPVYPIVDQIPTRATYTLQRYPRPGDPNPVVRVGVVSVHGGEPTWTDVDTRDDSYIARVYWTGDSRAVAVEKINRAQDRLTLLFADPATGKSRVVMEESSDTWVNASYARHYYEKKRQFLWGSERDGHAHLYLFKDDGSAIRQVTRGDWEVIDLDGVDEKKGRIFFTANQYGVLEQHLYQISDSGKDLKRLTQEEGTHRITMSPDFKYFIDMSSSHARPSHVSVHAASGKWLFDIGDAATPALKAIKYPVPEFFTVEHEGRVYQCRLWKPLDLDTSRKYPVIVYVYGGPHSQVVLKSWSRHDLWHAYMASQGYLVFSLDNRGSHGRGKAWEEPLLKRMGEIELADQVAGVEYLKSLPYVDPDRIGVWGWSYGGYMTLLSMFNAASVFRAGVSVAPVTDWRLYDSIYTERYMKLPADNAEGYDASAPLTHAGKLEGKLLVMHGDADDNVHVQNTTALARKLIDAGKDFELMLYPQREHSIASPADRIHLYRKMTEFFDRNLKGNPGAAVQGLTP
jgi:dipeptidyl-peptidase-4